jgi:hypothetical protein
MTRRLPVVLASKLDEYLEKRNELLRRESISSHLLGLFLIVLGLWVPWTMRLWMFVLAFYYFGFGVWNTLAYRRSLALESKSGKLAAPALKTVYCPRCGESNDADTKFCRKCSENLQAVKNAMRRRLPAFITNKLDRYIERRYKHLLREIIGGAVVGVFFLLNGIVSLTVEGINTPSVILILLACMFFVMNAWSTVVYKRSLSSAIASPAMHTPADTRELPPQIPFQTAAPSITESTTELLDRKVDRSSAKE